VWIHHLFLAYLTLERQANPKAAAQQMGSTMVIVPQAKEIWNSQDKMLGRQASELGAILLVFLFFFSS
jgi:hypothetical protein